MISVFGQILSLGRQRCPYSKENNITGIHFMSGLYVLHLDYIMSGNLFLG